MTNVNEITITPKPVRNTFGPFSEHRDEFIKMLEMGIDCRAKMGFNNVSVSLLSYFGVLNLNDDVEGFINDLTKHLEEHDYKTIPYSGMYYDLIIFF